VGHHQAEVEAEEDAFGRRAGVEVRGAAQGKASEESDGEEGRHPHDPVGARFASAGHHSDEEEVLQTVGDRHSGDGGVGGMEEEHRGEEAQGSEGHHAVARWARRVRARQECASSAAHGDERERGGAVVQRAEMRVEVELQEGGTAGQCEDAGPSGP
jgi:hypothetical protein